MADLKWMNTTEYYIKVFCFKNTPIKDSHYEKRKYFQKLI